MPQTKFCRQCGAEITPSEVTAGDEKTTSLLDESDVVATQRFDPRPTSPEPARIRVPQPVVEPPPKKGTSRVVLFGIIAILAVCAIVSTLAFVRARVHGRAAVADGLIYPGARKLMDVVSEGGGRAVSLETNDSFERVDAWYRSTMQPEKIVQLTGSSVVMKNQKATATIVGANENTHILLKIVP